MSSPETPRPAAAVLQAAALSGRRCVPAGLASAWAAFGPAGVRRCETPLAASDAACPTVLYEDRSIRYAGPVELAFTDRAPFATLHAPLAGFAAAMADG